MLVNPSHRVPIILEDEFKNAMIEAELAWLAGVIRALARGN